MGLAWEPETFKFYYQIRGQKQYSRQTSLVKFEVDEIPDQNYAAEIMMRREKVKTTNYLFSHILGSDSVKIKDDFYMIYQE